MVHMCMHMYIYVCLMVGALIVKMVLCGFSCGDTERIFVFILELACGIVPPGKHKTLIVRPPRAKGQTQWSGAPCHVGRAAKLGKQGFEHDHPVKI